MSIWISITKATVALVMLAALVGVVPAAAQEPGSVVARDDRVQGRTYTFPGTGTEVPYALFLPSGYDASRAWPLIVTLHSLCRIPPVHHPPSSRIPL